MLGRLFSHVGRCSHRFCSWENGWTSFAESSPKRRYSETAAAAAGPDHGAALSNKQHFDERKKFVAKFVADNGPQSMYPTFRETDSLESFRSRYGALTAGERLREQTHTLAGRIISRRDASAKLVFFVVRNGQHSVQILCSMADFGSESSFELCKDLRRGDIVAFQGYPYNSKTGELTLCAKQVRLLAPCMQELPEFNTLQDKELRYRNRHIDLLTNKGAREVFQTRAKIIGELRKFLDARGFVEVETPTLNKHAGGAVAEPFKTHLDALKQDLVLRIAPELHLKQLIVGGLEKVYEIGKSFRNEGIDLTHNPEFTTCEFYEAYTDYEGLMDTTEKLLRHIVQAVTGGSLVITIDLPNKRNPSAPVEAVTLDFSKPFRRISLQEELERVLCVSLPDVNDPASAPILLDLCRKHELETTPPHTTPRLFDALVERFIESQCIQPTFLCHFPQATSPLARQHRSKPGVTERFELYIGRMELCNAYTELNDPDEQRRRFQQQVEIGESLKYNEEWFCNVLEWGMPPTGGWGMGIDRLTMILTNRFSIKEVLLFPFMK